jgi:hypothetical protein
VLGEHVAAYRPGAKPRQTGLCSVFKFAGLTRLQADLCGLLVSAAVTSSCAVDRVDALCQITAS